MQQEKSPGNRNSTTSRNTRLDPTLTSPTLIGGHLSMAASPHLDSSWTTPDRLDGLRHRLLFSPRSEVYGIGGDIPLASAFSQQDANHSESIAALSSATAAPFGSMYEPSFGASYPYVAVNSDTRKSSPGDKNPLEGHLSSSVELFQNWRGGGNRSMNTHSSASSGASTVATDRSATRMRSRDVIPSLPGPPPLPPVFDSRDEKPAASKQVGGRSRRVLPAITAPPLPQRSQQNSQQKRDQQQQQVRVGNAYVGTRGRQVR